MDRIVILDESLVNKIAAGEVIERPASIVKELVENSIDAESKKIIIDVKEGGNKLIKVMDDGIGMSKRDAELSWKRHTTSKIRNADDLFSINTLGFRGEALASIAAVSQLTITTRQEDDLTGIKITVSGGKEISKEEAGISYGTSIEVKNLFFNTPARQKYLKSGDIEFGHIADIITRYALIHPEIRFRLINNGKELIDSASNGSWINAIAGIYGIKTAKELLSVDYQDEYCAIKGFISKPILSRPSRNDQSIYVNKRYIKKNTTISDALNNAYHPMMMTGRYPLAILDIGLPSVKTDVNVHPQKAEIRIRDERQLYDSVFNAVKQALGKNNLAPEVLKEKETKIDDFSKVFLIKTEKKYYDTDNSKQEMLVKETKDNEKTPGPEINIIGIINKTYLLAEVPGNLLLIDQHAAAERILYEKYSEQLINKTVKIQEILTPEILELTPSQFNQAIINKENLKNLGYAVEEYGSNAIIVRTLPVVLGWQFNKALFFDFLEDIDKNNNESLDEFFHKKVARMSCRTAIKAGDEITLPQIKQYINELNARKIFTCPHGRPIMVKWSFYELEKMFKRVV